MKLAIVPPEAQAVDEAYRLEVLHSLDLLDSAPEAEFDALVNLAKQLFDCPIALVSLIDERRQWFKARCGLDATETARDVAFCTYAIRSSGIMIVPDATRDPRFSDNPFVTGDPHIRFYAGVPINAAPVDGGPPAPLGTLCIIDTEARDLSDGEAATLASMANLAEALIKGRMFVSKALGQAETLNATAVRLFRMNRQLAQAERMAGVGSWHLSLVDDQLQWSDQVFAIHDLPIGQLPALQQALEFFPPHARAELSAATASTMATGAPYDLELDFISANGTERRVRSVGELEVVDGVPVALIGVFQDVTERFHREQGLRRSAHQDALTGIANRAGFDLALDDAIARSRQQRQSLALMLIDLDGFKQVNDVHGHIAGDELLQGIARRLEMPYLNGCVAARLGGDEFALIVARPVDCADVVALADRVLAALRRPIDISSGSVAISGTIGICELTHEMSRRDLIHCADLALYEAKRAGKGVARTWHGQPSFDGQPERRIGDRRR